MLKSGAVDSYKDAISKLFKYWNRGHDYDDVLSEEITTYRKLSKRQKELIPLINMGKSNREIADILNLSEHTVKVHMWRFFKKLKVNNRTRLLYIARMNGWLDL